MVLRKSFYIHWSAGRSPRVHEVNPGQDHSTVAQLVRVLPIAIRVPLRMGSSSHGGERKGQLGPDETIPMSGLPPKGYPEGSRRVWTPQ